MSKTGLTSLTKAALWCLAFYLALFVGSCNAHASWRAVAVDPATIASDFNHRTFDVIMDGTITGYQGRAFVGGTGDRLWLSPLAYRDAVRGGGAGMLLLLHEIGHTTGIDNERQANCFALKNMRPVLRRYWGMTARQAQSRYLDALELQKSSPAVYRIGRCLP